MRQRARQQRNMRHPEAGSAIFGALLALLALMGTIQVITASAEQQREETRNRYLAEQINMIGDAAVMMARQEFATIGSQAQGRNKATLPVNVTGSNSLQSKGYIGPLAGDRDLLNNKLHVYIRANPASGTLGSLEVLVVPLGCTCGTTANAWSARDAGAVVTLLKARGGLVNSGVDTVSGGKGLWQIKLSDFGVALPSIGAAGENKKLYAYYAMVPAP